MILLLLSVAWLGGLGCAAAGIGSAWFVAVAFGTGAGAGFALRRRPALVLATLTAAALFAGGTLRLEGELSKGAPGDVALLEASERATLHGVVVSEPEVRGASQRFVFAVDEADAGKGRQPSSGKILVTTRALPLYEYGDLLELSGRVEAPPSLDGFDYREHLARRGISAVMSFPRAIQTGSGRGNELVATVIGVRNRLGEALAEALPEPEASLSRGILLGQRSSIPRDLEDDFNRAGISHLVAISGSNVSLVAGLALSAFTLPFGRRRAVIAAMILIGGFVLLVGASPSVLRAGVMGVLMLGGIFAGRPRSALTAVATAAAILTAFSPLVLLDVAFQMSFAATLGLILLAPPIAAAIGGILNRRLPEAASLWLAESIAMTAAASLAVFPITAANFERVSSVAIPANLVAVPLFEAVVLGALATAAVGLVSTTAAQVIGLFAETPTSLMISTGSAFAGVPGASVSISGFGAEVAALFYAVMGAALWVMRRPAATPVAVAQRRLGPALPAAAVSAMVAGVVWAGVLLPDASNLRVTVLDVGQGDAILVETPSGHRILVDGGPSGDAVLKALGKELGASKRLDLVVLTHPQEDHMAGLVDVGKRFQVRAAGIGPADSVSPTYLAWRDEITTQGTQVRRLAAGESALAGSVLLEVLGPVSRSAASDVNNNSVVLRLTYGAISFLLTGDLGFEGEEAIMTERGDIRATVLKVGHHGSDGSSGEAFLRAVGPAVAVVSAGGGNAFGHPSPTTLLRLAGIPVYRTDRNGSVRFETDGRRLFVEGERGSYQLTPPAAAR